MKRRLVILICGIFSTMTTFSQSPVSVQFDECVDLVSAVWRLSDSREYNMCKIPQYAHDFDSVFVQFKDHKVVQLAHQYKQESGISYDAVASYGLHLDVNADGNVVLDDNFQDGVDASFDRWSEQQKTDFLEPLNEFYHSAKFHDWFLSQQDLYAQVEDAFNAINQNVDYNWFGDYFGVQNNSRFRITLSLLVGPQNYGCSAKMKDGSIVLSPVIGSCQLDENGKVFFDAPMVLPIVIHEFCHHYCNPLNSQYWSLMERSAEKFFLEKREQFKRSAYGSALTMMNETFVRSSVIRYMKTHYPQVAESDLVREEEKQGFILTQTICDALKQYEQKRSDYATMSDFMPVLAKVVNDFDLKRYKKEQEKLAKLNATYKVNIKDGATNVPSGDFTLVIKFSKPMREGIALHLSSSGADFPTYKGCKWTDDKTLKVDFFLESSHKYGFTVYGASFYTKDGYTAGENKEINFSTAD
ncbi:MAG: DUF4932 domain-containing protein [Bacteroidales bacterium]|nr:DUF4932 domain-containing protein [Bacteroidales bacterium]